MSRLTIDITDHQHQSLKAMAALQGKTIRQYALERLFPASSSGDQGDGDQAQDNQAHEIQAWHDLKSLLAQRIADGLAGQVSPKSMSAILDEELGAGDSA